MGKQSTRKQLKRKRERERRENGKNSTRHSENRILTELKDYIDDRIKAYAKYDDHSKLYGYGGAAFVASLTPGYALFSIPVESFLIYPTAFIFSLLIISSVYCTYNAYKSKRPEIGDYLKKSFKQNSAKEKWRKS